MQGHRDPSGASTPALILGVLTVRKLIELYTTTLGGMFYFYKKLF